MFNRICILGFLLVFYVTPVIGVYIPPAPLLPDPIYPYEINDTTDPIEIINIGGSGGGSPEPIIIEDPVQEPIKQEVITKNHLLVGVLVTISVIVAVFFIKALRPL